MSHLSNYQEEFLAKHLFGVASLTMPNSFFVRLHTADAGEDGTTAEVTGGSYAPQAVTFAWDNTGKQVWNSALLSFAGMPACTVVGFSIHSLASGGVCYGRGTISSTPVLATQTVEIAANALTMALAGGMSNNSREFLAKHAYGVASLTMPTTFFVELHTGAPGNDGTANVVSGGSYARVACTFAWDAGQNRVENVAAINFPGMPAVTSTHCSIHSLVTGGVCYATSALSSSVITGAGNTARFAAGTLSVELQ